MSLWEATLWTWVRSGLIALLSIPLSSRINREMNGLPQSVRTWIWGLLLPPLLTPGFLVGYAYGRGILALREWEWWNELAYLLLSLFRWAPLSLLILRLSPPPPLSPMGGHCLRLSQRRISPRMPTIGEIRSWVGFGGGKKYVLTFGLLFLICFHDFDLAALMGVQSWNVWLFDAHGAGLSLPECLRLMVGPLLVQLATILPILWFAGRDWDMSAEQTVQSASSRRKICLPIWGAVAVTGGCLIPWGLVVREGSSGLYTIWRQGNQWAGLMRESANGLVAGGASAVCAVIISRWICGGTVRSSFRTPRHLVLIPALTGPLVIGLGVSSLFQEVWLARYAPAGSGWLLALIVWLTPFGVLIQLGLRNVSFPESMHLGKLMKQSSNTVQRNAGWRIWWKLRGDEWVWTVVPLLWWSYFDLTISSILAPPGAVSAPVRLFNQMHYGHSAMLSALTGGAVLIPFVLTALLLSARRLPTWGGIR